VPTKLDDFSRRLAGREDIFDNGDGRAGIEPETAAQPECSVRPLREKEGNVQSAGGLVTDHDSPQGRGNHGGHFEFLQPFSQRAAGGLRAARPHQQTRALEILSGMEAGR
jgi:hypothetical protein